MLSTPYLDIKRLRSTGRCEAAIALLAQNRPTNDGDALEAAVCLLVCGQVENAVHVCGAYGWKTPWGRSIAQAFAGALTGADDKLALARAREAVADAAAPADAAGIYLLVLQKSGLVEEAAGYLARRWPDPPAGEAFFLTMAAEIAVASRNWRQACRYAAGVLAADRNDYRALVAASVAHFEEGDVFEALGHARRADALQPGGLVAILQIMRCQNKLGDHYAALGAFDKLGEGGAAEIQIELAKAYAGLERAAKAIEAYRAALAMDPTSVEAVRELAALYAMTKDAEGMAWLAARHAAVVERDVDSMYWRGLEALNRGDIPGARGLFRGALAVSEAAGDAYSLVPWPVPEPRLRHDYEQLDLLRRRGRLSDAGRDALKILAPYYAKSGDPKTQFAPEGAAGETLKRVLATRYNLPPAPFSGSTLGANDYTAIEDTYFSERLVVIDNFLSPEALAALREYSDEATIWKSYHRHGYMGAIIARGFCPDVLLMLSEDLRRAMPRVIGDEPLLQAWAFKYDQRTQGINMHADFARVNVNFWIAPADAAIDPAGAGMVVYDAPVPESWTFADYNTDPQRLAAYVKLNDAKPVSVPHRENRCVLFDSSLIHVTGNTRFKPGYENRRVNVTLLYGQRRAF